MNPTDLTQRPPRSPRVRLGGFVILPRMLDKCRALVVGKQGEYSFNCPLDQRFLEFAGLNADALREQVVLGKGDGEVLDWIKANSSTKPAAAQIASWSALQEGMAPASVELRQFFQEVHSSIAPRREDIVTWFDLLDLDDYVSFGGQP